MPFESITSRSNPTIKLARSLFARRAIRYREGLFVAEGVRVIETLIEAGSTPVAVLIDESRQDHVPDALLESAIDGDARILLVNSGLYRDLADTETPQAVIALFRMLEPALSPDSRLVVVLDGISDPGNAGTILRSCRAFGVDAVAFLHGSVDPFNPKVVRASAGMAGRIPIIQSDDLQSIISALEQHPAIYVTDPHQGESLDRIKWEWPALIVFGSEASGPSAQSRELATNYVRIPMTGDAESLNVGAAATIVLYETFRASPADQ